jgi:hypothetical protein
MYDFGMWLRDSGSAGGSVELRVTLSPGLVILMEGWVSPTHLGTNWTLVEWNLTVHYPGSLDVAGLSGSALSGVDFGGAQLSESLASVQVT